MASGNFSSAFVPVYHDHGSDILQVPPHRNATPMQRSHLPTQGELESIGSNVRRNRSANQVAEMAPTLNILNQPYGDLREKYSLGPELGRGQFGIIRVCVERATGTAWACKCISKSRLTSRQDLLDVQREVQALTRVTGHPAIIGLKEVIEDAKRVYLITELCEGGELFERISSKQRYNEHNAAQVFFTLASVVEYCHAKGVMHRDLKPENILLVSEDSDVDVKVVDFGLAVFLRRNEKLEAIAGSAYYIAPEILGGSYSFEADIWSLGIILYILLCGMPPFWHEEEEGIFELIRAGKYDMTKGPWKRISAGAKDLVRKILVPNPEERLTINQIFDHPWLREHCDSEGLQSPPIAIPVAEVVPALSATAITVRPVPLADLSARFRRSNSGESLASSNFSEFSPRGSRKWVLPSDNSSSFSGTYSGIMKNAAEAARKIHIPRGGSGELPPVYNLRSPHSGEFSSHRSLGDPGTFQVQKSADYAVAQRSPQQQQGSFLVKTSSLGTNRAPASSRIPKQSSGDLGLNLSKPRAFPLPTPSSSSGVRQRSPDHSALNSTNARDDARERLRSLSFGKLDANEAKKTEKLASRGNSPAFPAGDNLERRTSQDKPANDGKSDGNGRQATAKKIRSFHRLFKF